MEGSSSNSTSASPLTTEKSAERRRFPRRALQRGVGVLYRGVYTINEGVEVSEGGVAFRSADHFDDGAHIVVSFQIPGGQFVSVICEIRATNKQGRGKKKYGCQFKDIKFENKREIRTFVSARN